jgi:hypothetical protein
MSTPSHDNYVLGTGDRVWKLRDLLMSTFPGAIITVEAPEAPETEWTLKVTVDEQGRRVRFRPGYGFWFPEEPTVYLNNDLQVVKRFVSIFQPTDPKERAEELGALLRQALPTALIRVDVMPPEYEWAVHAHLGEQSRRIMFRKDTGYRRMWLPQDGKEAGPAVFDPKLAASQVVASFHVEKKEAIAMSTPPPAPKQEKSADQVERMRNLLWQALPGAVLEIFPPTMLIDEWRLEVTLNEQARSLRFRLGSGFRLAWLRQTEPDGAFSFDAAAIVKRLAAEFQSVDKQQTIDLSNVTFELLEDELSARAAARDSKQLISEVTELIEAVDSWCDTKHDSTEEGQLSFEVARTLIRQKAWSIRRRTKRIFDTVNKDGRMPPLGKKRSS